MFHVLLAGPVRPKRVAGHHVYRTWNDHGEWSIRVEPGGCQLDNFHSRGGPPHVHRPGRYDETADVPGLTADRAWLVVWLHLETNGRIVHRRLLRELMHDDDPHGAPDETA